MKRLLRLISIVTLCLIGAADIFIYWNTRLVHRAQDEDNLEEKIQILKKAVRIYPLNDRAYYEKGKTYFALSMRHLARGEESFPLISDASASFYGSLRINPANPFGHFYYAQSLWYEDLLSADTAYRFNKELISAAQLAGENRELCFEAGKRLLAEWQDLGGRDRSLVLEILGKALERDPEAKFAPLMRTWGMNVRDVEVLEKIMPDDPEVFRSFGTFLGEKEYPLSERHRMLSLADYLQFKLAERLLASGKREYEASRPGEAKKLLNFCLGSLYKIRFFHKLSGQYPIDDSDFLFVLKSVNYYLARVMIDAGEIWEEIREYVHSFLELEDNKKVLIEMETYLEKHGLLDDSVLVHLYSKLERYGEMAEMGDRWLEEFQEMPESNREDRDRTLFLLGQAYSKLGRPKEAAAFYERLLRFDPENLQGLLSIRQLYQELGDEGKSLEANKRIERIRGSRERNFSHWIISRGEPFSHRWHSEGITSSLELHFQPFDGSGRPLVTIELNREVIWDAYLDEPSISLEIEPVLGLNTLRVLTNTHPFGVTKMIVRPLVFPFS